MKILIVCRYKENFERHMMPFITEQADTTADLGHEVAYFQVEGKGVLSYFKTKALKRKIHEFNPDIVHAHYGLSGIPAVLQRKVPVVTTFHNGETATFVGNLLSSFFSLFAVHRIYVAQHIHDLLYFKKKNSYTILPCGINPDDNIILDKTDTRTKLGLKDDKKYILFGGGFDNLRKNYSLLKEAIQLTGRKDIEVIEMHKINRQRITELMCACDLFALPSKSEGSPQALKEAMACNCPIIATDVADIKHLLGDVDGHFICTFNPNEVKDVLKTALEFTKRTHGRERILDLGLDNISIAKKLIDIYKKTIL